MKQLLVIISLIAFFHKNSFSQTISSQKGLTTIVFDTRDAIFSVILPDDLQNGDNISGTFSFITAGITEAQIEKSLMEVRKYKFNFSNPETQTSVLQKLNNINPFQQINLLPLKITSSLIFNLTESTGKIYSKEIKPDNDPYFTVSDCISPVHFLLGKPYRITGTFDGNAANTRVSIGNTYFPVLAESPRQCIVQIPEKMPAMEKMEIKVVEDFKPKCIQSVIQVKMSVGSDKITIKKGETITVFLTIKGLEGMDKLSFLTVENKTPTVISLKDGNKQNFEITSDMFKEGKDLKMNFDVKGITSGDFSLDFNLDIPEDFPEGIERQ